MKMAKKENLIRKFNWLWWTMYFVFLFGVTVASDYIQAQMLNIVLCVILPITYGAMYIKYNALFDDKIKRRK